jgi:hypothetical protein
MARDVVPVAAVESRSARRANQRIDHSRADDVLARAISRVALRVEAA